MALHKKPSFAVDVLKLAGGTTFVQLIGLLLAPVFAAIFDPEAFGVAAVFASIVGTLQVAICLRYELTITLAETDEDALHLLALSLLVALFISALTIPVFWFGATTLTDWFNAPGLQIYLWLIPLSLLLNGVYVAVSFWATRRGYFGRLSFSQVSNSLVALGGRLLWGLLGYTTGGTIILSTLGGTVVSAGVLSAQTLREDGRLLWQNRSLAGMWAGAKRYYKFPLYNTWASLLNTLSWQLPVFLLSVVFSPTVVGYYALGNRIIRMPMSLIGNSISQVFYQRTATAATPEARTAIVRTTFNTLVALSLFPMLILTIVGDQLFQVFLGNRWVEAGVYSQILAGWTFFWFISSPLSSLYNVHEEQGQLLGLQATVFLSRLLSLAIGGWLGNARLCLMLFGVSGILVYGHLSLMILKTSGVSVQSALAIIGKHLLLFTPVGALLLGLKLIGVAAWINVGVAVFCMGVYGIWLIWTDKKIHDLFLRLNPLKLSA